jgi:hypothetical protein
MTGDVGIRGKIWDSKSGIQDLRFKTWGSKPEVKDLTSNPLTAQMSFFS